MADESVFTAHDALEVIRAGAADVLSLYPGKHGGVRATQYIARIAEAAGLTCTIGSNLEREVATAAMAHVSVSTPNIVCERYPGDLIGPLYSRSPCRRRRCATRPTGCSCGRTGARSHGGALPGARISPAPRFLALDRTGAAL